MAGNNSIVLSQLLDGTNYIDQISYPKINTELVLTSRVKEIGFDMIGGIKNDQTVNIMVSTIVAQQGNSCGIINPTGSVTPTQAQLQVCSVKYEETICENQIQLTFLGMGMPVGSYYDGNITPAMFQEAYVTDKFNKIQDALEFQYFQSTTLGFTGSAPFSTLPLPTQPNNYVQLVPFCNGFLNYFVNTSASMSVIPYSGTYSASSGSIAVNDIIPIVNQLVLDQTNAAQNAVAQEDTVMLMSVVNYRKYVQALTYINNGTGNFGYPAPKENHIKWSIELYGTGVMIYGMPGLVSTNFILLTPASNLVIGFDGTDDQDRWQLWYEKLYDEHMFRSKMKLGVTVKYPQYVAIFNGDRIDNLFGPNQ